MPDAVAPVADEAFLEKRVWRIFSYHLSPPTDRLRLNGAVCDIVTLTFGKDTDRVESCVRWAMLAVVERLHFVPGKR